MDVDHQTVDSKGALLVGLQEAGLLIPCGVPGVYGHNRVFEDVLERFDQLITLVAQADGAEFVRFPPLTVRQDLERSEFLDSFPQLLGTIFSFSGSTDQHKQLRERANAGEDWSSFQAMTDVVLTPAACYPIYSHLSGVLSGSGRLVDMASWVYRHEPSLDPARLQFFRVREMVRVGDPEVTVRWRDMWRERAVVLLRRLGLNAEVVSAADPFFGRGGRLLAANQREQQFKFEIVIPISSAAEPTAVASFNYHQDHFGRCFGISTSEGAVAHSACLGFGMERVVLALFKQHGFEPTQWPADVRRELWR